MPQNAGDIARKYIKDPQLLSFIDAEVSKSFTCDLVEFLLQSLCSLFISWPLESPQMVYPIFLTEIIGGYTVFYCEYGQCSADANDKCRHGKLSMYFLDLSLSQSLGPLALRENSCMCLHQVLCDRHYGGINYPVGGVGGIAKSLAKGLVEQGSEILYKANVTNIIIDQGRAVSSTLLLDTCR